MVKDPQKNQWVNVPSKQSGLNVFDTADEIDVSESPDNQNISYDGGLISPIGGSKTLIEKPAGESGSPLQLIKATTSDGIDYMVTVFDNHFYLYHDENEEYVRINTTYIPDEIDKYYGNISWNNGRGDDRLYGCNGIDNVFKWHMAVSTANGAQTSGSTTLTLTDSTRFPATGSVVIKGGSGEFVIPYTANSLNVLTLTGTLGQDIDDGVSVAMEVEEKASMEIGKVLGKHGSRMFVMNYYGGETVGWYSVLNDPEDYTTGTNVNDASTFVIADGNGEITAFHDFGQYAVIEKSDSFHSFSIEVASDLGSKLDNITPIASGESIGPTSQPSTVKILNDLYYPTITEGFNKATLAASGNTTSLNYTPISTKIKGLVNTFNYDNCRSTLFERKALWAVALAGGSENLAVLVFDADRNSWSKYFNFPVRDWITKNYKLYYLDSSTGDVKSFLDKNYDDDNNPYESYHFTKVYNFGLPSQPKTCDLVYIDGVMQQSSKFYVDVMFNEGGILKTQTYKITKDTDKLQLSNPLTNALGEFVLGQLPLGWVILKEIGNVCVFRCYLGISNRSGFFNIQLKFYSNSTGFWGIGNYGFSPIVEQVNPPNMVVSPMVNS